MTLFLLLLSASIAGTLTFLVAITPRGSDRRVKYMWALVIAVVAVVTLLLFRAVRW